jgi:hypothetical protein
MSGAERTWTAEDYREVADKWYVNGELLTARLLSAAAAQADELARLREENERLMAELSQAKLNVETAYIQADLDTARIQMLEGSATSAQVEIERLRDQLRQR